MAALPSDRVHQGFWIDATRGPVFGAIITTTSSNANLVVAVLSVLVTITGSHLWDLIAFVRFYIGFSNLPRGALHHQVQILARNITSPGSFLLETARVGWSWRRRSPLFSLAIMAALALVCSAGFLTAGIFVSQIVSTSDLEVLVQSDSCGWVSWRNESTDRHQDYQTTMFNQAVTYAQTCYNKTQPLSQCNVYVKQAVPIQKNYTECPFPGMCLTSSALRLDTGLVDSNDVFGINTNADIRVQMQRVFTCAPLDGQRYFTTQPMPVKYLRRFYNRDPLPGEQLLEWFLGPTVGGPRPFNSTIYQSNEKVVFSTTIDLTPRAHFVPTNGTYLRGWDNSTFDPIPALRREDADTHVIAFHNNALRFFSPTDDPIFAAHTEKVVFFDNNSSKPMYVADKPASFLGCAEQMRFCFGKKSCTQLLGAGAAYSQARDMAPTPQQNATLRYMFFQSPTFYAAPRAPMLATRNAISFQLGVPSNHWEAEVKAWVNFLLAVTQTTITHIAAGPGIVRPDFDQLVEPLEWPGLCSRQRMAAPDGFSNISVFALAFVVAISGIIILTNLILLPTLRFLRRRFGLFQHFMVAWDQESILQVQRKAYEAAGYLEWQGQDAPVPKLVDNMLIPGLGTEEYQAHTDAMLLLYHDTRRSGGSYSLFPISHPTPSPSRSTTPHLPLTCGMETREEVEVIDEAVREEAIEETYIRLDTPSRIVPVSKTSTEQLYSRNDKVVAEDLKREVSDGVDQEH